MSKDQKLINNQNVEIVDKLIKERDKLKTKISKCSKWLNDPLQKRYLSNKHYMLINAQYNIMQAYRIILDLRINDLQENYLHEITNE